MAPIIKTPSSTGSTGTDAVEPSLVSVLDPLDATVEWMLGGDEAALRTVYREVHPPLLRYPTVLVGPDDAEDVASQAWAQALHDLGRFGGGADGFRGWLTTIGRNRALDPGRH